MANVLGELFGDIATAIRSKTGEEGTMKPAEFPEKIDGIAVAQEVLLQEKTVTENGIVEPDEGYDGLSKVTVDVQSGGGSLPTGVYLEEDTLPLCNSYIQMHFMFKGCRYCASTTSTGANGKAYRICKLEDGAWIVKISSQALTYNSLTHGDAIECNGKIHFIWHAQHSVYDGNTTLTELSDVPGYSDYKNTAFVQDGLLKYYAYSTRSVYVWDEASDTWTVEVTFSKSGDMAFLNYDGRILAAYTTTNYSGNGNLFEYKNGALTELFPFTYTFNCYLGRHVICNGYLYRFDDHDFYKMNLQTGEEKKGGRVPRIYGGYNSPGFYCFDNKIRIIGVDQMNHNRFNMILHDFS